MVGQSTTSVRELYHLPYRLSDVCHYNIAFYILASLIVLKYIPVAVLATGHWNIPIVCQPNICIAVGWIYKQTRQYLYTLHTTSDTSTHSIFKVYQDILAVNRYHALWSAVLVLSIKLTCLVCELHSWIHGTQHSKLDIDINIIYYFHFIFLIITPFHYTNARTYSVWRLKELKACAKCNKVI